MSSSKRDFEKFVVETLLQEFIETDIKALAAKQKADKQTGQKKRDQSAGEVKKTDEDVKIPGVTEQTGETEEEKKEKKIGTIGNNPEKLEVLKNADQNWKQMVAYSKNVTRMVKNAMAKMQSDDSIRMKKAGVASQRLMKMNMGKQYTRLKNDVGGDDLTSKVALMQIIAQMLQDMEAGK